MKNLCNLVPVLAAGALIGLAGCASHEAAPAPAPAPMAAPAPAPPPMAMTTPTPRMLRQVQAMLKRQGLYKGRVDGVYGPMTKSAVTAYQQKNGLQTSGELDQPTLDAMHVSGGSTASSGSMPAPGAPPASGTTNP